jgi:hypothetical protein
MGLFSREDKLTTNDLKNILLWYERMNVKRDDITLSDNRTMIKIQAMLIYQEESYEEESRFRRRRRDESGL